MTNNWDARQSVAEQAVGIFIGKAETYGFELVRPMGTEFDSKDIYCQLKMRRDKTSIMLRHRPDAVCFSEDEAVLIQIKGEPIPRDGKVRDRVFIEVDSWAGAMEWNSVYRHVAFAFVELKTHDILFAWADELSFDVIYMPKRHCNYDENLIRMAREYADKEIKPVDWRGGSGTPCFLYPKDTLSAELCSKRDFHVERSRPVTAYLGGSIY